MHDDGQLAVEVDVQAMQMTLQASHPQALPDEIASLPDHFASKLDQLREFHLTHNKLVALPSAQSSHTASSCVSRRPLLAKRTTRTEACSGGTSCIAVCVSAEVRRGPPRSAEVRRDR